MTCCALDCLEMTSYARPKPAGKPAYLPRGWGHLGAPARDLVRVPTASTRSPAASPTGDVTTAFWNGLRVIRIEQRTCNTCSSRRFQGLADSSQRADQGDDLHVLALASSSIVGCDAALGLLAAARALRAASGTGDPAREHRRARRLRPRCRRRRRGCSRTSGFVDTLARVLGASTTEQRLIALHVEPVRGDALAPRGGRADRRVVTFGVCRSSGSRAIWAALAGLGLVLASWRPANHYWLDVVAGVAIAVVTRLAFFRRRCSALAPATHRVRAARAGATRSELDRVKQRVHAGGAADRCDAR